MSSKQHRVERRQLYHLGQPSQEFNFERAQRSESYVRMRHLVVPHKPHVPRSCAPNFAEDGTGSTVLHVTH